MRNFFKRMRFLFSIHHSIPFLKDFFISKEINKGKKIVFVVLILGYIILPFDIIPDFLVGIGLVDDVAVALFIVQLMIKVAPESLKEKYKKLK